MKDKTRQFEEYLNINTPSNSFHLNELEKKYKHRYEEE